MDMRLQLSEQRYRSAIDSPNRWPAAPSFLPWKLGMN
jgi:hypothetical protein